MCRLLGFFFTSFIPPVFRSLKISDTTRQERPAERDQTSSPSPLSEICPPDLHKNPEQRKPTHPRSLLPSSSSSRSEGGLVRGGHERVDTFRARMEAEDAEEELRKPPLEELFTGHEGQDLP